MSNMLKPFSLLLGAGLIASSLVYADASPSRPNMVLIMADDLGYGDTGFNGNSIIQTPHLDSMAKDGALMTNFHAGAPVCSPTRGTYLTGRHAFRYGIFGANEGHLPKQEITIAEILKEQGYRTGHFGKWHLGTLSKEISSKGESRKPELNYSPPAWHGYDSSFVTESAVPTWDPSQGGRAKDNPFYDNGVAVDPTDPSLKGGASRVVMDRVIPFIEEAADQQQPFFAVVWFHAPHAPVLAGPEYLALYPDSEKDAAHYYGAITEMDEQIGRLRTKLDQLGLSNNTLITFTSDNGPEGKEVKGRHAGQTGGLRGRKRSLYEGGVRVPTLAFWPGNIEAGRVIDTAASTLDYLPTVVDITGAHYPDNRPLDGTSLLSLLTEEDGSRTKAIPFRHRESMTIIEGNLKLVSRYKQGVNKAEMYHLLDDPAETKNIIGQYPEQAATMIATLNAANQSFKDSHSGADYTTEFTPVELWIDDKVKGEKKNKKKKKNNNNNKS
ncbi:MAG: sulfatase-like hydrolase/transferase [Pseudomonadales bacterium]